MPIRKQDYPPDWKQISIQVRTEAGWKCEWCQAPNDEVIQRTNKEGAFIVMDHIFETNGKEVAAKSLSWARLRFHGLSRIVLTVAHLD